MAPPWLIVGLGNPGDRYRETRHNVGFDAVAELVRRREPGSARLECNALVWSARDCVLATPQTYMNRSGYSVRCLAERHGFGHERIAVVYDEVHLPLGRLRFRPKGSPGGHRGMESVVENMRSPRIARLRLGVGPAEPVPGQDLAEFVLARFEKDEMDTVREMIARAADALECWMAEGADATMNRFNQ